MSFNRWNISLEQCQPQGGARLLIVWEQLKRRRYFLEKIRGSIKSVQSLAGLITDLPVPCSWGLSTDQTSATNCQEQEHTGPLFSLSSPDLWQTLISADVAVK